VLVPLVCLALSATGGCSRETKLPCHPVRGQVLLNDRPLAEAVVVFHALAPSPLPAPKPLAYTDADGRFAMTTLRSGDGAMIGEYAVTVELRESRPSGEETARDGRNVLPARYAKPETSSFRYHVVEGENEVPPLKLKAR